VSLRSVQRLAPQALVTFAASPRTYEARGAMGTRTPAASSADVMRRMVHFELPNATTLLSKFQGKKYVHAYAIYQPSVVETTAKI